MVSLSELEGPVVYAPSVSSLRKGDGPTGRGPPSPNRNAGGSQGQTGPLGWQHGGAGWVPGGLSTRAAVCPLRPSCPHPTPSVPGGFGGAPPWCATSLLTSRSLGQVALAATTSGGFRVSGAISESLLPALHPRKLQTCGHGGSFSQLCCRVHSPGSPPPLFNVFEGAYQPRL